MSVKTHDQAQAAVVAGDQPLLSADDVTSYDGKDGLPPPTVRNDDGTGIAARTLTVRCIIEFIGTFFVTSIYALAGAEHQPLAPLATGGMLIVMTYMGGHISGAHFNPAVTLGVSLRGYLHPLSAMAYVGAQMAGAFAGAFQQKAVLNMVAYPMRGTSVSPFMAVVCETLYTFGFVSVFLFCTTTKTANYYFGIAMGFYHMGSHVAIAKISGAALNPAMGTALPIAENAPLDDIWIYWAGPITGAILAAGFYGLMHDEQDLEGYPDLPGSAVHHKFIWLCKYLIEYIGTFFLVATYGLSLPLGGVMGPIAPGCILVALVYLGGNISGGHYNPAVSIAFAIRGHDNFNPEKGGSPLVVVGYIVSQLLGAFSAAFMMRSALAEVTEAELGYPDIGLFTGKVTIMAEFAFTMLLVLVYLNTMSLKHPPVYSNPLQPFYGLAIGFTLLCSQVALGTITGCALNPALATALIVAAGENYTSLYVYWVGPMLGCFFGGIVFWATNIVEFDGSAGETTCVGASRKYHFAGSMIGHHPVEKAKFW